jgi:hypothetical protein
MGGTEQEVENADYRKRYRGDEKKKARQVLSKSIVEEQSPEDRGAKFP